MTDSIQLSSEDGRRIKQICEENDPASDPVFAEFLSLIPNPDDRQFFLDYHRGEIEAYVEMGLVMKKASKFVRDYAEAGGHAHVGGLFTLIETPPDPGWFDFAEEYYLRNRDADAPSNRRWNLWQRLQESSVDRLNVDRLSNAFGELMDSALSRVLQDLQAV